MKLNLLLTLLLGVAAAALAQQSGQPAVVRHVIGLENIKRNASGQITVQNGALLFKGANTEAQVPVATIDDIFIGTEATQGGGKAGRAAKTAAIAAPYGTGRTLSLLMRTKVDILTVSFHNAGGGLHGAIFALPIGQALKLREQLVQAGAHASPLPEPEPKEASKQ